MTGDDPDTDRALYRAARRDAFKQHHPDRGGDVDALHDALRAIDERWGRPTPQTPGPIRPTTHRESSARRMLRALARRARRIRPGSRRYIHL